MVTAAEWRYWADPCNFIRRVKPRKNLIMSLADSCFEFLRDLEKEHDLDLVRRRAAQFTEDVRHTTVD